MSDQVVCASLVHNKTAEIMEGYLLALNKLVKETGRGDVQCNQMSKTKTYFAVVVRQTLFGP